MRVKAVRPFRWAGEHVEPGTLLDVTAAEAAAMLRYRDVEVVSDSEAQPPSPMTVQHNDPVVEHRDPIAAPAAIKRRRR